MDLFDKLNALTERVTALDGGPMPFDTVIDEIASPTEVVIGGRRTLMCGSNNYFGLTFHPAVIKAAHAAIDRDGAGTTGSRVANGSYAAHVRLERAFADAHGKRHAMVFTTGYQANLGMISGLCASGDTVLLDIESHASIYDGARLSGAQVFAFRHNSAADLGRKLARLPEPGRCLVVVEGLYSISGDVAPLSEILKVCRDAGAYLMVDEAHSFGAYGPRGLGCADAQGVVDDVDFLVGTFSKALAGVGGYAVSNHDTLKLLHFSARPYVFTASGSPANIAGVEAAFRILRDDRVLRQRLWDNVRRVRKGLSDLGFVIGPTESPIVPIEIGTADRAVAVWRALLEAGVYVNIVLPPACKPDACLIRTSYSAAHTPEQIDLALSVFGQVGRALSVIGGGRVKLVLINPRNRVSLYGDYLWEPLSLGYVAAVTPPHWEVELIDEQCEGFVDYTNVAADLVGLTAFTTQATRAYEIARQFRSRGIPVVMGGIHASLVSEEASRYVDSIFLGECEVAWPQVIRDVELGQLQPKYDGGTNGASVCHPDRRLFRKYRYEYVSSQTSRGCPMDCSFCSVTAFNGRAFRMREIDDVISEVAAIPERDIIFVDDDLNGFSRKAKQRCLDLFRAMTAARLNKRWITQVTINFGDDDELPALARESGCAGVFIGLESTDTKSLTLIRKDGQSQRRGLDYYRENVARIRSHGIGVVGSFILGIDTQDMNTIASDILRFAEESDLDGLNPTILTPLPGTRDFARYEAEGRILFKNYPEDWEKYTLAFPVTSMPNVTGAGLMRRYVDVLQFFRPEHIAARYWRTYETVSPDAAWHTFLWNRVWTNYCLRTGVFRRAPLADTYPTELAREVPVRPSLAVDTIARSVQTHRVPQPLH